MKLIEADGKRLLRDAGIAVPVGFLYEDQDIASIPFPCVLKAQVLSGRRGQRGLVRRATDAEAFTVALKAIQEALQATPHAGILVEPEVAHEGEWLVSVDLDRAAGAMRLSFSEQGGMSVEHATSMAILPNGSFEAVPLPIRQVAVQLVAFARANDALSVEVNPLAILPDGSAMALDAKIELDDAALGRHPEWESFVRLPASDKQPTERERAYVSFLEEGGYRGTFGRYVELDGDVALILSGGGASLVALDALQRVGLKAANYCEISGNPDPERTKRAASIVLSHPNIKALWLAGSFANFTDIQATVMAVLAAVDDAKLRIPIVIRRDGPSADSAELEANAWAHERGMTLLFHRGDVDLDSSASGLATLLATV